MVLNMVALPVKGLLMTAFQADLEFSYSTAGLFDAAYRKAFGDVIGITRLIGDSPAQRNGIDVLITLSNGRTLAADEKASRKAYETLWLETQAHGKVGWMLKPLQIDWLAYGMVPTQQVYLLPWPALRSAYEANKDEWQRKYAKSIHTAKGVCVPVSEVYEAMATVLKVVA